MYEQSYDVHCQIAVTVNVLSTGNHAPQFNSREYETGIIEVSSHSNTPRCYSANLLSLGPVELTMPNIA